MTVKLKQYQASREQARLAEDNGALALAGAAVSRAIADLWGNDELLALDSLLFFVTDNCREFLTGFLQAGEVDPEAFFKAAAFYERERFMLFEIPGGIGYGNHDKKTARISNQAVAERVEKHE
jgi:hypothetical protein